MTQFLTQFLKKETEKEGTGRNSRERRPISNKIPTPAMGSHESGCPSSFLCKIRARGGFEFLVFALFNSPENRFDTVFDTF